MEKNIMECTVSYSDKKKKVVIERNCSLKSIVDATVGMNDRLYVAAFVDGKLKELNSEVSDCENVSLVEVTSVIGNDLYKRSLQLLMLKAIHDVMIDDPDYVTRIMYSLGRGFFCKIIKEDFYITEEFLLKVKERMNELVKEDIPFRKLVISTQDAINQFNERGLFEKADLFKYRRVSKANLYAIDDYLDYYYGYMVPSTGYLTAFDLLSYEDGFVLVVPKRLTMDMNFTYHAPAKLYQTLREAEDWGRALGISGVGQMNNLITQGKSNQLILVQEALMEKKIADIAEKIKNEGRKVVLISGPSSSGKTTFSMRLSVQLAAHGLRPHPISMDNFFKERVDTPRDENGQYDFESIRAMDMGLFNDDMRRLIQGEEVDMPEFDFIQGKKIFKGNMMKMQEGDVLVVEGIHALNPVSSESLPKDKIFKVYISALQQLNIDEHNRISTTDTRLLRRIVRDARTRGNDARNTIAMWESVRVGEEKNIFPYQEEADVMFNSALLYELSAIKQYVEPLLFCVPQDCNEYYEAKRLLKFLDYFLGIDVSLVPQNSLMREFIGGGCFGI